MRKCYLIFRDPGGPSEGVKGTAAVTLIGEVGQDQIEAWKKAHPLGIYAIKVGGHIAYFKMPGFDELNCGYAALEPDKIMDFWGEFANVTFLGGSEEVLKNATLFAGAVKVLQKKVDGAKAELVEL